MITAIISVETLLLVLLVVLVAGLLRTQAEILRRLGPPDTMPASPQAPVRALDASAPPRAPDSPAPAISGATPAGDALALDLGAGGEPTLLAFLSTGCSACGELWRALAHAPLPRTVIVAHGPERERPSALRRLAPGSIPVVMSSAAWSDYRVPGSPYFVLVGAGGQVAGEGVATTAGALASLLADAGEDARQDDGPRTARGDLVDRRLAAAGIGAEHPSLYPGSAGDPLEGGAP